MRGGQEPPRIALTGPIVPRSPCSAHRATIRHAAASAPTS